MMLWCGERLTEHNEWLQKVLAVLERNHALLNKDGCLFEVEELEILGFKISGHGICKSCRRQSGSNQKL